MNFIIHICAFSRGALNVRSTRSHPTLAPRPQIWLMKFTGFCTVAGEDELNRKWKDLGTEAGIEGDDLTFLTIVTAIFQ